MTRKITEENCRRYVGIEEGLSIANRKFITINEGNLNNKKDIVESIIDFIISLMMAASSPFKKLYVERRGGGSGYEGLKITKPDEFDIDLLLRLPKIVRPELCVNNIPGHVNLKLGNVEGLRRKDPELYATLKSFIDHKHYLLTKMKNSFLYRVFNKAMKRIPDNVIFVEDTRYMISSVENKGPAITLTITGPRRFHVSVDLVFCILLNKSYWPREGFKCNPFRSPSDFFLVPKSPKSGMNHIERYWRLSFQPQENVIMADKQRLKPTIRILKRIRDKFQHKVSSYAIKTLFLRELRHDNPSFKSETPDLWESPLSFCVVYMLEVYAKCLSKKKISYFWYNKMNLIEDLTSEEAFQYCTDIRRMLHDIRSNPFPETILDYLRLTTSRSVLFDDSPLVQKLSLFLNGNFLLFNPVWHVSNWIEKEKVAVRKKKTTFAKSGRSSIRRQFRSLSARKTTESQKKGVLAPMYFDVATETYFI